MIKGVVGLVTKKSTKRQLYEERRGQIADAAIKMYLKKGIAGTSN